MATAVESKSASDASDGGTRAKWLLSQAEEYLKWESFEDFKREVQTAVKKHSDGDETSELEIMFGKRIGFGTAGLRSQMGGGYSRMNDLVIVQTSQGLIKYAESLTPDSVETTRKKGVVIGFDARYHSDRFAAIAASVFTRAEWNVRLLSSYAATPLVPFSVTHLGCALGIVVTASHNPAKDNGFKVYWDNGCQIISPRDSGIAAEILRNLEPWHEDYAATLPEPDSELTEQLTEEYTRKCTELCCFLKDANRANFDSSALSVVYTAMHGVGTPFVKRMFDSFGLPQFNGVPSQIDPNPDFPTVSFPNPEEKGAMQESIEFANGQGFRDCIILANDPDADRLAVAERVDHKGEDASGDPSMVEFRVLNGNEIAMLLADWYFNRWCDRHGSDPSLLENCVMLASTVSSKFLQKYCSANGLQFEDTLTGFKWIGNTADSLRKRETSPLTVLFAYEVEIGYLMSDVTLDKDGIRSAAVFAEMAGFYYSKGKRLADKIEELRKQYGFFEMINSYVRLSDQSIIEHIFDNLRSEKYPTQIGDKWKISRVRDVTTGFDSGTEDQKCALPQQSSNMITFWTESGATITLRPSGTEPKLKYYVETQSDESAEVARAECDELCQTMLEQWVRPFLADASSD